MIYSCTLPPHGKNLLNHTTSKLCSGCGLPLPVSFSTLCTVTALSTCVWPCGVQFYQVLTDLGSSRYINRYVLKNEAQSISIACGVAFKLHMSLCRPVGRRTVRFYNSYSLVESENKEE